MVVDEKPTARPRARRAEPDHAGPMAEASGLRTGCPARSDYSGVLGLGRRSRPTAGAAEAPVIGAALVAVAVLVPALVALFHDLLVRCFGRN